MKLMLIMILIFAPSIATANSVSLESSSKGLNYTNLKFSNTNDVFCTSYVILNYYGKLFSTSTSTDWHEKMRGRFKIAPNSTHSVEYYNSNATDWDVSVLWTRCD